MRTSHLLAAALVVVATAGLTGETSAPAEATSSQAPRAGTPSSTLATVTTPARGRPSRSTAGTSVPFSSDSSLASTGARWVDGERYGDWTSVYDGYGSTRVLTGAARVLSQSPRAATSPEETHAALAVTTTSFRTIDFTVRQRTVEQLRTPEANPWEVPWALWAYTDDEQFYYLVLKPNGWELGKEDPAYPGAQRYLATGSEPRFPVGPWHTVRVRQSGSRITVWGDGRLLTRFADRERPYSGGQIGLYTEDAHVEHADLVVRRP